MSTGVHRLLLSSHSGRRGILYPMHMPQAKCLCSHSHPGSSASLYLQKMLLKSGMFLIPLGSELARLTRRYTALPLSLILYVQKTLFGVFQLSFGSITCSEKGTLLSRYLTSLHPPRHTTCFRSMASPSSDPSMICGGISTK